MATEQEHIELANRNHDAIDALLRSGTDHPEWVATIAFYKALQIVEATFAFKRLGHGSGHHRRLRILQDGRHGFGSLCPHYEALLEASEVARYLGARSTGGTGYSRFSDYMSMADVRADLLAKRLANVEMHAAAFLSSASKSLLKPVASLL